MVATALHVAMAPIVNFGDAGQVSNGWSCLFWSLVTRSDFSRVLKSIAPLPRRVRMNRNIMCAIFPSCIPLAGNNSPVFAQATAAERSPTIPVTDAAEALCRQLYPPTRIS